MALGEVVPDKQFVDKLPNVDRRLSYLRPALSLAPINIEEIIAVLTDGYSYHYQDRQHQHQHGNADRGRFQRRHPRGQGAPVSAAGPLAMAGMNAVAGGEKPSKSPALHGEEGFRDYPIRWRPRFPAI